MMFKRVNPMSAFRYFVYLVVSLLYAGGLWLSYQPSAHSQISPATRPHTHSSQSSGGSTLAPGIFSPGAITTTSNLNITTQNGVNGVLQLLVADPAGGLNINVNGAQYSFQGATSSFTSTKACAANYTRVGPNFCAWTAANAAGNTIVNACTSVAAPAGAKAALLKVDLTVTSTNTLNALDLTSVTVYNDATCVTNIYSFIAQAKEFVALVATAIANQSVTVLAPVVSGNVVMNATATGTVVSRFIGYFD